MVNKKDDARKDFGVLLALAYAAFVDELRQALADGGFAHLHRSFGYVARALADGPLTLREVADLLGVTSPGALKTVADMEEHGYVERLDDPSDARARRVSLTKKGRAALAAARAFHGRFERELARDLGTKVAAATRAALERMVLRREKEGGTIALRPM
jgi:DNA-binding MarR family transcriptional regulator